ncbi:MAG: CinA family protein [Pseudomonadota bacterium]|nr:CinA family protein [Pseudomonadota bacterium]
MFSEALRKQAAELLDSCRRKGWKIASAESCTGGLIAALLTEIPGSSDVFERGFVTYSNTSKTEMLGVDAGLITKHGAVSEEIAAAMAQGAQTQAKVNLAVAVTGIAGPGGGAAQKPVGLVYVALAARGDGVTVERCLFSGGRSEIRIASVAKAVEMLLSS